MTNKQRTQLNAHHDYAEIRFLEAAYTLDR